MKTQYVDALRACIKHQYYYYASLGLVSDKYHENFIRINRLFKKPAKTKGELVEKLYELAEIYKELKKESSHWKPL